jgi:hypothetical protein
MHLRIRLFVLCALATALALALPAAAQRRNAGSLRVVVEDAAGKPAAGARVILQASHGDKPRAVEVDADGRHVFRLARGHYDLRAHSTGSWSDWQRNIPVRPGRRTEVRLRLVLETPPEDSPPAAADPR